MFMPGYGVAKARNELVSFALDNNFDYLFMVDDDMTFHSSTLCKLLETDSMIVSAWAMQLNGTTNVLSYDAEANRYDCMSYQDLFKGVNDPLNPGVIEAKAVGMACTLFKVELFKSLDYPYFVYHEYSNRTMIGEDVYFCDKLKREASDRKIKIDLRIKAGHVKEVIL